MKDEKIESLKRFNDMQAKIVAEYVQTSVIEELEKIKEKINSEDIDCQYEEDYEYSGGLQKAIEIIDKHISELKGEINDT